MDESRMSAPDHDQEPGLAQTTTAGPLDQRRSLASACDALNAGTSYSSVW